MCLKGALFQKYGITFITLIFANFVLWLFMCFYDLRLRLTCAWLDNEIISPPKHITIHFNPHLVYMHASTHTCTTGSLVTPKVSIRKKKTEKKYFQHWKTYSSIEKCIYRKCDFSIEMTWTDARKSAFSKLRHQHGGTRAPNSVYFWGGTGRRRWSGRRYASSRPSSAPRAGRRRFCSARRSSAAVGCARRAQNCSLFFSFASDGLKESFGRKDEKLFNTGEYPA